MIGMAWTISFLISFPPLVGWRPNQMPGKCNLSDKQSYILYSAFGSFYIPVALLLIVYAKIFDINRKRLKRKLTAVRKMSEPSFCDMTPQIRPRRKYGIAELYPDSSGISDFGGRSASSCILAEKHHSTIISGVHEPKELFSVKLNGYKYCRNWILSQFSLEFPLKFFRSDTIRHKNVLKSFLFFFV